MSFFDSLVPDFLKPAMPDDVSSVPVAPHKDAQSDLERQRYGYMGGPMREGEGRMSVADIQNDILTTMNRLRTLAARLGAFEGEISVSLPTMAYIECKAVMSPIIYRAGVNSDEVIAAGVKIKMADPAEPRPSTVADAFRDEYCGAPESKRLSDAEIAMIRARGHVPALQINRIHGEAKPLPRAVLSDA